MIKEQWYPKKGIINIRDKNHSVGLMKLYSLKTEWLVEGHRRGNNARKVFQRPGHFCLQALRVNPLLNVWYLISTESHSLASCPSMDRDMDLRLVQYTP